MTGVLNGIRVLDFGRYIAGPYCGALLGDFGAEVIRIEKREGSEDRWTMPVGEDGTGAAFMQMNRNKLSITLDPAAPEGREAVRRLVAVSDVVIANMPLAQLKELGLDYETLEKINPRIIVFMNSCFGSVGPFAKRPGFETIAQGMSGSMHLTGDGITPMRVAVPANDFGTATFGALGILAALLERQKSGRGQLVETSLLHTALNLSDANLIEEALLKKDRIAKGNRSWHSGPSDCYRTKDGWIVLMVIGPGLFKRWARLMGEEKLWTEDPRFATDQLRGDNGEALSIRHQQWCASRTTKEALAELEKAHIPAGPIYSLPQTLADEHIKEAGFLEEIDYPGLPKPAPVVTTPVKLSRTPGKVHRRPPLLGEHTHDVLTRIARYTEAELDALRAKDVI
ncbi:MAG TPA: CoA transferase [Ramlibacter sp.]|uniref:CaiB/BaiF CoA transferase family protein n=1 Tax=Ramlibacter sp. TaxID=1917967 RepID=UPI002B794D61|nr:CoA transferase [Ramlibacter sp.]HVZ45776.1 CoA transferase [Ramlibacter sp.]